MSIAASQSGLFHTRRTAMKAMTDEVIIAPMTDTP